MAYPSRFALAFCPDGAACPQITLVAHQRAYYHQCPKGALCQSTDPEHRRLFTHPSATHQPVTNLQAYNSPRALLQYGSPAPPKAISVPTYAAVAKSSPQAAHEREREKMERERLERIERERLERERVERERAERIERARLERERVERIERERLERERTALEKEELRRAEQESKDRLLAQQPQSQDDIERQRQELIASAKRAEKLQRSAGATAEPAAMRPAISPGMAPVTARPPEQSKPVCPYDDVENGCKLRGTPNHNETYSHPQEDTPITPVVHQAALPVVATPFWIVTFNILAQSYATASRYWYVDRAKLAWNQRMKGVVEDMKSAAQGSVADIYCLQEVETSALADILHSMNGFEARHVLRPGKPDGCAILYSRRFREVTGTYQNVYAPDSDHVGQVVVLEQVGAGKRIGVANVHVNGDPKTPHHALSQCSALMRTAESVFCDLPFVVCGDFNRDPLSGLYRFMTQGRLEAGARDADSPVPYSGYAAVDRRGGALSSVTEANLSFEPLFTFLTDALCKTTDYIFASPKVDIQAAVANLSHLPQGGQPHRGQFKKLTSVHEGSDHIPVAAKVALL
eukprot:TRINITY_DN1066_c0_g1_i1.p1 TRINITY_DN1066_c0_g1~~TRINITY_DN1066_c0_g1_i1.p1  ORF type:complete len:578 (+),score=98.21 TRINITY_DN1066_c0_g1_i1:1-1734(+)